MPVLSKVIENAQMIKITNEFKRLGDKCYLDNAGAPLYPEKLLKNINEDFLSNIYMNPHSDKYTNDCIDQVRSSILRHFKTDSSNYTVIFTSGSTQSMKLVMETFQFSYGKNEALNCGSFVYLQDNHTSVLGLRELAKEKHADIVHISHEEFIKCLDTSSKSRSWTEKYKNDGNTLFIYPAQNNFNGYKYPIDGLEKIKNGCLNNYLIRHFCKICSKWYILLDTASYVSTNKLDLSENQPDFVCVSFYKIFGFPTGLGALLVKNTSQNLLNGKIYFGGGTVDIVISSEDYHVKKSNLNERFEDGTSSFLSILALKHGFDTFNILIPKVVNDDIMETISHHTFYLAKDLYNQLKNLQHSNGKGAVVLYMDSNFDDIKKQGGFVTFNLVRDDESYIGYAEFQHMANLFGINIRTGCFCNAGSCQRHLNMTNQLMKDMYNAGHKCSDEIDLLFGKPTGCIRVSFGYYNTYNDIDKLVSMICKCFIKTKFKAPQRTMVAYKNKIPNEKVAPHVNINKPHIKPKSDFLFTKYSKMRNTPNSKSDIVLAEIAIYPIKSCGSFKIHSSWKIGSKGFDYDREWMIVKDNGVCLTQKHNTRMCMIYPKIDLKKKVLTLFFKGKTPISIPLEHSEGNSKKASLCQSKVCTDTVEGYDCGDDIADWISQALEVSFLRLIRQSNTDQRTLKYKETENDPILLSLSNQAQYLLINKATVRWLKDKIQDDTFIDSVDRLVDRFRGNLIIESDKELVEREWQSIIIGKHEFKVDGLCTRCQMVCIDQHTGEKTVEPLRTISEQFNGKLRFGIYLRYIGTTDESKDVELKTQSLVQAVMNDEDNISR